MESILNHGNRWKKEKGLTLVETVVALAIIVIISVSAVSMALYSANALTNVRLKSFFSIEADNYTTLFLSYNEDKFTDAVNELTGISMERYEQTDIYYDANYQYVESDPYYYVRLSFEDSNNTMNINIYSHDSSLLFTRSVSK